MSDRYDYAQEWIDVIKMIWSDRENFDFKGKYLDMKGVRGKPKPFGGTRPVIMNAGASATGQAFAMRNCDAFFLQASRTSLEETQQRVRAAQDAARAHGREIGCYTVGVVTCRPTQEGSRGIFPPLHCRARRLVGGRRHSGAEKHFAADRADAGISAKRSQYAQGMGGLPIVGDPDHVAAQLADLAKAGLTGIGISLVNYIDELPYFCDEVIGRLRRMGLRARRAAA